MRVEKLSVIQLFCLIVIFELGSAVVVGVGLGAKQAVWLPITIGTISGIILFILYDYIIKDSKNSTFIEILKNSFGKVIGNVFAILYIAFFLYFAARVLRDFGELMGSTILYETPLIAINTLFLVAVVYGCVLGVEVIGRMSEIFIPYVILFGGLLFLFIYIAGLPDPNNLKPITGNGILPAIKATMPVSITFPFGEVVTFIMFIPLLNRPKLAKKTGIISILVSGLILLITNLTIISVLGAESANRALVPLVDALGQVNIANFIQRLDPLAIIVLIVCGYFKITIFMCAGLLGLNEMTKNKFKRFMPYIIGVLIVVLSIVMADNWVEHIKIGLEWVPKYLHLPAEIYFPLFLALFITIKRKIKNKSKTS